MAAAAMSIEELLRSMRVWRGRGAASTAPAIPTGFAALDAYLPGGGWPRGAVTEICLAHYGAGELRLLLPAIARLAGRGADVDKWVVWVAPPFIPYAPALHQHGIDLDCQLLVHPRSGGKGVVWAVEQAIRSGSCAAVLAWVQSAEPIELRRLQLAAESRDGWVVLFRPIDALREHSPAALRIALPEDDATGSVRIVKCRGRQPVEIPLSFAAH